MGTRFGSAAWRAEMNDWRRLGDDLDVATCLVREVGKSFCQTSSPSSESTAYKVFASAKSARSLKPRPVIRPGKRRGSLKEDDFAGSIAELELPQKLEVFGYRLGGDFCFGLLPVVVCRS